MKLIKNEASFFIVLLDPLCTLCGGGWLCAAPCWHCMSDSWSMSTTSLRPLSYALGITFLRLVVGKAWACPNGPFPRQDGARFDAHHHHQNCSRQLPTQKPRLSTWCPIQKILFNHALVTSSSWLAALCHPTKGHAKTQAILDGTYLKQASRSGACQVSTMAPQRRHLPRLIQTWKMKIWESEKSYNLENQKVKSAKSFNAPFT